MIWGRTLEPGKLYTEVMGEEVQLSMAAIDSRKDGGSSSDNSFCQIVIKTNKGEYVLCTLVHGIMFQQNLDLKIMPREKVTFIVQGTSVVYLVGYTSTYPEDEGEFEGTQEEDLETTGEFSAWEAIETEASIQQDPIIKVEPEDVPDDPPDPPVHSKQEGESPSQKHQKGKTPTQQQRQSSSEPMEGTGRNTGQEEEIIFSVADVGDVRTEAPHPRSTLSSQTAPLGNAYGLETTDDGTGFPRPSNESDCFFPETQQQSDVPQTPIPATFTPTNTGADLAQQHPQGVFPLPSEQLTVSLQAGCIRHPMRKGPSSNTQRPYPPRRPQNRSNQGQSTQRSRLAATMDEEEEIRITVAEQSIPGFSQLSSNTQRPYPSQRPRHVSNQGRMMQHSRVAATMDEEEIRITAADQAMPGPSQLDLPGPSNSDGASGTPMIVLGVNARKQRGERRGTYQCRVCGRTFTYPANRRRHERIHTGERPFPCRFCDRSFTRKIGLQQHENLHTGRKPFSCGFCGVAFPRKKSRANHELICSLRDTSPIV